MPFASRRQARWAFANKKRWARRWAHETDFASLPASKDDAAPLHGPGGLLATPGLGRRRWRATTKAKQIRGNLYRGDDGKFQAGGASSASAARGETFFKAPKRAAPARATAAPKGRKGGKGRAAAKPKKVALTPEQKKQQRDQQQAQPEQQPVDAGVHSRCSAPDSIRAQRAR